MTPNGAQRTWLPQSRPSNTLALQAWNASRSQRLSSRLRQYAETGIPLSLFSGPGIVRYNTTLHSLGYSTPPPRATPSPSAQRPKLGSPVEGRNRTDWEHDVVAVRAIAESVLRDERTGSTPAFTPSEMSISPNKGALRDARKRPVDFSSGLESTELQEQAASTEQPQDEPPPKKRRNTGKSKEE